MRLSIATKVFLAFAGMIVLFTSVIMIGTFRTQRLYAHLDSLNRSVVPLSLVLSDLQNDLKSYNILLGERDPVVLRRTLQVAQLVSFLPQRFSAKIGRAGDIARREVFDEIDAAERQRYDALRQRLARFEADARAFAAQSRGFGDRVLGADPPPGPDSAQGRELARRQRELLDQATALDRRLATLRNDLRITNDLILSRANEAQRSNLYAIIGLSVLALVASIALLLAILWTLRPLTALTEAAKRVARGDYRPVDAPQKPARDEIDVLAREFNSMAQALEERDRALRDQHAALLKSERLAAVGRMTSLITHELRNPLSSIGLNAEIVHDDLLEHSHRLPQDLRSDWAAHLETLITEVDRLRDITEEYLVYARLPSPRLERTDLAELLTGLIDFHTFEWLQQGVEVQLQLPHDEPPLLLHADANQLRQALLNLIKNAVETSPDDDDPRDDDHDPHVTVCARRLPEQPALFCVTIDDRGPGIDPDVRDRIFEPFFTTKSRGTGLGLAMTQQIIEEHGGHIEALPNPAHPRGTRFTVTLPAAAPPQPREP